VLQRNSRIPGRENGAVGRGLLEQLVFVLLRRDVTLQEQMGVGVDEPGRTVIWLRSITRAFGACPWIWASGPTALILSPSIRIPTLGWTLADRPSTSRPL